MRRMIVRLNPADLVHFLQGGTSIVKVVANPLPPDARIVDARCAFGGTHLELVVESESYPELQEGNVLSPIAPPRFKTVHVDEGHAPAGRQKGGPAMETED
jgi:hypothetical protein